MEKMKSLTDEIYRYYENVTPLQAALSISLIFLYICYLILKDMNLPPGPRGLPFLGYWPFLKADICHIQLHELSKKYGEVFSLRVTGRLFIYLGSLKSIKEAHLVKTECFGKRFSENSVLAFFLEEGVAAVNGEPWKVLRKFFVSKFKEYGMNAVKENAASSVYEALKEFVEELHDTKGQPVLINDIIMMKSMKILRRILFNDQGITMAELRELNDLFGEMSTGVTIPNMLLTGKFSKYFLFPLMPCSWRLKRCCRRMEGILFDIVNRQKTEYDESQASNIISCYFKERDEKRRKGDPTAVYFTDKALVSSLIQFVTDGVMSIGVLIGSFLLTLVQYPEEQEKIYKEILDIIGQERLPTLEDKSKLPYTNAFIYEVIRLSDFFPMFPSLECSKETTLHGYKIPEGSITLLNMYGANRNPKDFENPDDFNPSRYIATEDRPRAELPILFGVGKRACIGEAYTMFQVFLFLTTIVQNFRLSLPEGSQGSFTFWAEERAKICFHPRTEKFH